MSYDLLNPAMKAQQELGREAWFKALDLARFYGWQPLKTQPPRIFKDLELDLDDWDGNYWTNDGQIVKAEDATALATALENSLDDIPDFSIVNVRVANVGIDDELPEWLSPSERAILEDGLSFHGYTLPETHPFEFFAGTEKQKLIEFIKFCHLGSFLIM